MFSIFSAWFALNSVPRLSGTKLNLKDSLRSGLLHVTSLSIKLSTRHSRVSLIMSISIPESHSPYLVGLRCGNEWWKWDKTLLKKLRRCLQWVIFLVPLSNPHLSAHRSWSARSAFHWMAGLQATSMHSWHWLLTISQMTVILVCSYRLILSAFVHFICRRITDRV